MDRILKDDIHPTSQPRVNAYAPRDAFALDWSALLSRLTGVAHAAAAIHLAGVADDIAEAPLDHEGLGGLS